MSTDPQIIDLGRLDYAAAYDLQLAHHAEVLAERERGRPVIGRILLVEHDPPVITVSRRPGARDHLIATPELLARSGVTVAETDRGGDITYHGPGQLVAYPIIDLNRIHAGLHAYMRLLESAVIDTCLHFGVTAGRDACATGVWVNPPQGGEVTEPAPGGACSEAGSASAKICAMGVRVRRWVSMHGLALNVTTNLAHFNLIVPCGLVGRPVTSLERELAGHGRPCPPMSEVKAQLAADLSRTLRTAAEAHAPAS